MSDDLIKRLRDRTFLTGSWEGLAATRIEQLEESNKQLTLQLLAVHGQAADALDRAVVAEAKLAKAVEIGNKMAASIKGNYYIPNVVAEWNAALAELRGGK